MAQGTQTVTVLQGDASATLATAVANFNTAMATFLANSGGTLYQAGFPVTICDAALGIVPDTAVATNKYFGWAVLQYPSAS